MPSHIRSPLNGPSFRGNGDASAQSFSLGQLWAREDAAPDSLPQHRLQMGRPFINTYILFIVHRETVDLRCGPFDTFKHSKFPNPSSPHRGCICESKCKRMEWMLLWMAERQDGRQLATSAGPHMFAALDCNWPSWYGAIRVLSSLSEPSYYFSTHATTPFSISNPSRNRLALLVAPNYTWLA